jgi:hypothetical protein
LTLTFEKTFFLPHHHLNGPVQEYELFVSLILEVALLSPFTPDT